MRAVFPRLTIVSFTCVFLGFEFTYCVSSIGNSFVLGFALFAIWRYGCLEMM